MAPVKYQDYLAAQLLSEGNIVTYRSLSRALKVHANTAKEMLHEFHRSQNARKPSTIHATYLLSGIRNATPVSNFQTNGTKSATEDVEMGDSFVFSSSLPDAGNPFTAPSEADTESIPVTSITLVREAELEDVRASYTTLHSIHVYSLAPSSLQNLHTLSAVNQVASASFASTAEQDPLESYKTYGTIHNPHVKRRTGKRAPVPPAAAAPATAGMKPTAGTSKPTTAITSSTTTKPATNTTATTASKPATLKKQSSNIMSSFAKAPPPKPAAAAAAAEDSPMADASDDEGTDADFAPGVELAGDNAAAKEKSDAARAERKEREEKLRRMMDEDDPEEGDDEKEEGNQKDPLDEDNEGAAGEATLSEDEWPASPPPAGDEIAESQTVAKDGDSQSTNSQPQTTTTANGKRRGRRRVIKKKKVTDDEGFIVTREEPEWESFSEDESSAPPSQASKASGTSKMPAGEKVKPKVTAPKAGAKKGGNIMSFFAKR